MQPTLNFPFRAVLMKQPGSEYAAHNMTVGSEYIVHGMAGGCWVVSTDLPNDKTIISPVWFSSNTEVPSTP